MPFPPIISASMCVPASSANSIQKIETTPGNSEFIVILQKIPNGTMYVFGIYCNCYQQMVGLRTTQYLRQLPVVKIIQKTPHAIVAYFQAGAGSGVNIAEMSSWCKVLTASMLGGFCRRPTVSFGCKKRHIGSQYASFYLAICVTLYGNMTQIRGQYDVYYIQNGAGRASDGWFLVTKKPFSPCRMSKKVEDVLSR